MRVILSVDTAWVVTCSLPGVPPRYLLKVDDGEGNKVPLLDLARHPGEPVGSLTTQASGSAISAKYSDPVVNR